MAENPINPANQELSLLNEFADNVELTIMQGEETILLEGMVGTCGTNPPISNNCKCFGNNCTCKGSNNCSCY